MKKRTKTAIKITLLSVMILLFIVYPSRNDFVCFVASDDSMAPLVNTGELVIVNRNITHLDYGDVVIFSPHTFGDEPLHYLWCIVALPGDNISIKEDMYNIKGKQIHYRKTGENILVREGYSYDEYEETMPNGKKNLIFTSLLHPQQKHIDETFTLSRDQYYLLGDLRSISCDSRLWGAVTKDVITGKAVKIIKEKGFFKSRWAAYKYLFLDYEQRKEGLILGYIYRKIKGKESFSTP